MKSASSSEEGSAEPMVSLMVGQEQVHYWVLPEVRARSDSEAVADLQGSSEATLTHREVTSEIRL